jgi:L-threonylcarbamoyladenylate synthase
MEIVKVEPGEAGVAVVRKAVEVLAKSGVIMHATDTCYGLAADVSNANALEKLYAIKKMPDVKPVSMMVSDISEAEKYGEFVHAARSLAEKFWPGPLTLIVRRKTALPFFFNENSDL